MDTLREVLALGGPKNFGVFSSKVSRTLPLADGHTTSTSFPGQVFSCDDEVVLATMAKQGECNWSAKKDSNRLSQKVSGLIAAARNGHEDSINKVRTIVNGTNADRSTTPDNQPAAAPEPATV